MGHLRAHRPDRGLHPLRAAALTERLCEQTPPDRRPGSDFYGWDPESPARELFLGPPAGDELLASFGREVVTHQPLDYAKLVLTDLARFVDEDAGIDRTLSGHPLSFYRFAGTSSEVIDDDPVASFYGPYEYVISGTGRTLGDLQQIVRVHGSAGYCSARCSRSPV